MLSLRGYEVGTCELNRTAKTNIPGVECSLPATACAETSCPATRNNDASIRIVLGTLNRYDYHYIVRCGEFQWARRVSRTPCENRKTPANTERNCRDAYSLVPSLAGTSCAHLDEDIFDDELMTGFVDNVRPMAMETRPCEGFFLN